MIREPHLAIGERDSFRRVLFALPTEADTEIARYASLVLNGQYAAEYLRLGLVTD